MPKYTVEVNDASGKKLSYDFDAPEGVDVGKYTQTPEFQAGVADAYRNGKLKPVEARETAATNSPAPGSTGPTTDTFLGGLKRGVQEGIAGVANIGTNIVRMVGDIDDKAESFLGVRPVAGSVGMLFANANPRMTEAALDPIKTAKETREVQAVANSYAEKKAKEAAAMPEPKGFLANTGQVLGNVAVQAPAAIGASATLGPVGGMAALGAAGNYKGDLGSAVYGGTVGAVTGKLNVIAAPMKIGGRVLTGALTNAGQEVLLNDNPTGEGIAKTAAVGALFGAATPKFVPKDTKPKPVSTFRDVPAPDGPVVVPDRLVEKLQVKLTGLQKKADKIALVEKERELAKLKNKLTAMQKQELADARAKLAEIQQKELADARAQLAKLEAGELEPLPVPDAVPEATASVDTTPATVTEPAPVPVSDASAKAPEAVVESPMKPTETKPVDVETGSSASTASFLGSGAAYHYGSQAAAKAAQVLGVAKQEVKTGLQNMRVRANQAARNWNMVKLRTALADQSAPLAEAEVDMGLRKKYGNQYPDFTTGGKAPQNENSSYEARRLVDNVVRGKVHNHIQEFDDALKTVFDIDPDLNGLRDHMLATRLKELQVRSAQSGQPNYNLPGANPRTGDAGWDSARISSALKDPRAGIFEQVTRKARGILEAMVDEEVQLGILTPQRAAKMRADNQFYSPLFREEHYPVGKSTSKGTKGKKFSTDEAETFDAIDLRGSTEPVKDPISAFAAKIQSRRMAIERYKVVAQYLDQVDQYGQNGALGVGRRLPMNSQRDPNNPMHHVQKGEDVAVKFESGESVEYAVPEDIGQALSMGNLAELGFFGKAMNKLGKMQTHFVTLPPTYIARNPLRDYRSAVGTSPVDYSIANSISGLTAALDDMFHPNARVKAAREVGAVGGSQNVESHGYRETGTYEAPRPSLFTEPGRRLAKQELATRPVATLYGAGKKAVKGVLVDWWNTPLTKLSQASETTTRMGLFERSGQKIDPALGRPYNPQERAFLTQNTLTDFSMRGTNETADLAFRTIPFLRARMLGMMTNADQTASLYATNPGQFLKTVAYMAIPAITIHAWNNSKFPEMAKNIDPEAYENADILILNDKVDSEGYATGVVVIPKEGLTRSISNAITHTMNAYRDNDYDNYLRTAVKFVAESIAPVDALNAQGEVDLGRTATSMLPPSIAAVIGATQNKDIRTGKKLFAGDTDAFSRGLYVSDTKTGKRDTSMLARTLSGAANWAAGDMQGSDPFGMLMSPVGIEQVGRNVFGQVGVAGAKVLDPVFGSLNTKLFKGTNDYPHTYRESGKAALRMLDPKNSLGRAFLRTDTTEEDKHVKLAAGTQGTVTNSINRAAESLTNNDQFLNADSTPEQKMSVITQTLAKHGLVSETSPLSPEVLGDVLSVVERKMSATSMEFDSVDYTLQRLNNRGKAFFLYSLLRDPKYKPGGPKNDRLQIRVKKMTENKMLTDGVLDELTFLLEKQEREKARPAQEVQPRKLFQTPVPAPPSPLFRQPGQTGQPGELN